MSDKTEKLEICLGPGKWSKAKALTERLESVVMEANRLGLSGREVMSVKLRADFDRNLTYVVLEHSAKETQKIN